MTSKSLELVYKTHTEGKEKVVLLRDFLDKCEGTSFCENVQGTMEFFYKHIPLHFAYEEILMNALLKSNKLTEGEASCIDRIFKEHKTLKTNFEKLNKMSIEMGNKCNKEQKEDFLRLVNDTVDDLIKHAEYEDQYLYPVSELKADDVLLSAIQKEMSKIVY